MNDFIEYGLVGVSLYYCLLFFFSFFFILGLWLHSWDSYWWSVALDPEIQKKKNIGYSVREFFKNPLTLFKHKKNNSINNRKLYYIE